MTNPVNNNELELTRLLIDAADEKQGAIEAFYESLLESEVWVASTSPKKPNNPDQVPIIGKGSAEEQGIISIDDEGNECIPIFTQESFVHDWALRGVFTAQKKFKNLIWTVGEDTWLYINPNQEVGKELTSWELGLLKQGGMDAIADLAGALNEGGMPDIEVRSDSNLYPKLKRKMLPVLELCKNIEEAFLVAVKEDGSEDEKPMVGLRYSEKASNEEKTYIRDELKNVGAEMFVDGRGTLLVMDDLGDTVSTSENIFSDSTPFFIGKKELNTGQKIISSVKSIFSKSSEKEKNG